MSRRRAQHLPIALLPLLLLLSACVAPARAPEPPITLTIVGTNDVHGELLPSEGRGGFVTVSGYVDALRAALPGVPVESFDAAGVPAGAAEAMAFALLGRNALLGIPNHLPRCTGASRAAVLGEIVPGRAPLRVTVAPS